MATISLIKEAIAALKDRTGSSVPAISKWIEGEKKLEIKKHVLRAALKKGIDDGTLVMIKASYKLSAEAKKSVVKVAKKSASTSKPKAEVPKSKLVSTKNAPEAKKVSSAPKKVTAVKKNVSSKKVSLSEKKVKSSTAKKPQAPKKASVAKKSKMKESIPKE